MVTGLCLVRQTSLQMTAERSREEGQREGKVRGIFKFIYMSKVLHLVFKVTNPLQGERSAALEQESWD